MAGERRLRAVGDIDPVWVLWQQLPPQWRGPVIGEGIDNWKAISENDERRLDLTSAVMVEAVAVAARAAYGARPRPLAFRSTDEERTIHAAFIRATMKSEELWVRFGL